TPSSLPPSRTAQRRRPPDCWPAEPYPVPAPPAQQAPAGRCDNVGQRPWLPSLHTEIQGLGGFTSHRLTVLPTRGKPPAGSGAARLALEHSAGRGVGNPQALHPAIGGDGEGQGNLTPDAWDRKSVA